MTEEEKKAQEEAAAAAASENGESAVAEGEGAAEGAGGEGAAAQEERAPKDLFYERIRTNIPDGKYDEDEQEYFRRAGELFDKYESDSKKYNDMNQKWMRLYEADPELCVAILDSMDGVPFLDAFVKYKGEEALTMREGMEGWDSYKKAVEDRKADRQRYMALMDEIDGNMKASQDEFAAWADEIGLDDTQRAEVWKAMQGDLDNMSRGKFTKDIYNRYRSALNHDRDVDGAYEQGKADGTNQQIEAKRKEMKGSGLPNGNGGGASKEKEEKPTDPTAEWLAGFRHR